MASRRRGGRHVRELAPARDRSCQNKSEQSRALPEQHGSVPPRCGSRRISTGSRAMLLATIHGTQVQPLPFTGEVASQRCVSAREQVKRCGCAANDSRPHPKVRPHPIGLTGFPEVLHLLGAGADPGLREGFRCARGSWNCPTSWARQDRGYPRADQFPKSHYDRIAIEFEALVTH